MQGMETVFDKYPISLAIVWSSDIWSAVDLYSRKIYTSTISIRYQIHRSSVHFKLSNSVCQQPMQVLWISKSLQYY